VLQPHLDSRSEKHGRLFLTGTALRAVTRTAGEAPSILLDQAGAVGLKQVYGGWSSGRLLGWFGEDAVTLSFGREVVQHDTGTIAWETESPRLRCRLLDPESADSVSEYHFELKIGPAQSRLFHCEIVIARIPLLRPRGNLPAVFWWDPYLPGGTAPCPFFGGSWAAAACVRRRRLRLSAI
jgi:hypothetical protein